MSRWILRCGAIAGVFFLAAGLFVHRAAVEEAMLNYQLAALSQIEVNAAREWRARFGFIKDLQKGMSGADVALLQKTLAQGNYFNTKDISGFYGNKTQAAVKTLQKEEELPETGKLDAPTRKLLNKKYFDVICPKPAAAYPDFWMEGMDKEHALPLSYAPEDLVSVEEEGIWTNGIVCMRKGAAEALARMIRAAAQEGIRLGVTSGFRSAEVQEALYDYWVSVEGARAKESIAPPGGSEHQLGVAVDLTGASVGYEGTSLRFGETAEGRWLDANGAKFGFVLSYPKGKEAITGYVHEPWHYRFVGEAAAAEIKNSRVNAAEYFASHKEAAPLRLRGALSGVELSARAAFAVYVSREGKVQVLLGKDSDVPHPIASITKLLTALAAEKSFSPGAPVRISSAAAREAVKEGQTRLEGGESFRVEEMLTLLLVESSNPAARALADAAGYEEFLGRMREEAARLGLASFAVVNPTGLDPQNKPLDPVGSREEINAATPREVASLLQEVLEKHPALRAIVGVSEAEVRGTSGVSYRVRTTNELLASAQNFPLAVIGGKTGETPRARQALVFAVESPNGNGYVIGVLLESEDRFEEAKKMIEWFAHSYDWLAK